MFGFLLRALLSALLSPFRSRIAFAHRDRGSPASTRRVSTDMRPTAVQACRPHLVAVAFQDMGGLARSAVHRPTETVIEWRRHKFREHWTKLTRSRRPGRPTIAKEAQPGEHRASLASCVRSASTWPSQPSRGTWVVIASLFPQRGARSSTTTSRRSSLSTSS